MSNYDPLPPNGSFHVRSGKLVSLIREALSTKYAISLVCRSWSTIVAEFLYDFIIVRDAVHIPLLVDQLSRADTHIPKKVQRIDFMCLATAGKVHYNGVSYNARELARAAAKLIRLCPCLRALSSPASLWERGNSTTMECYSELLASALTKVKNSLECLEWRSQWDFQPVVGLSRLILPRLRVLLLSSEASYPYAISVEDGDDKEFIPKYSKDRSGHAFWTYSPLHTADAEYYRNWIPSYDEFIPEYLPSLKHLIITSHPFWFHLERWWSTVPQIETLTFQKDGFRYVGNEGCRLPSSVHTIIFHARDVPITPPSFPHIKRIGLVGTDALTPKEFDHAFDLFVGGGTLQDDHFPILNMIRFVDASSSGIVRHRALQFKLWERRCRNKGVRLEDEMGQVISYA